MISLYLGLKLRFAEICTDKISFAIYNVIKVKWHQDFIVSLAIFQFFVNFKLQSYFCFLSSPFFFSFSCLNFFFFVGHLVRFILVGKVIRKAFRILGLDERKGRWVVEKDFHGNFWEVFDRSLNFKTIRFEIICYFIFCPCLKFTFEFVIVLYVICGHFILCHCFKACRLSESYLNRASIV